MGLDLDVLRRANVEGCEQTYHPSGGMKEWTPTDWACAMAGEAGEACNEVKKLRRIAETPEALAALRDPTSHWNEPDSRYSAHVGNVAEELADVVIYADLLAARLGINLAGAIVAKFNRKSEEVGSPVRLPDPAAAG